MKTIVRFLLCLLVGCSLAHAQQYGWVRVAQLGNQFTGLGAVEFVDTLHGWTAEADNMMYRTTDGGNIWTPHDAAAGFVVSTISMKDTAVGWAVGSASLFFGTIIRTTDGGRTWSLQRRDSPRAYEGSSTTGPLKNITSGYANYSIDTGKVVQTTNGGTTWSERTIADNIQQLGKVQFVDSLHGWIAGGSPLNGVYAVLRTTDGGLTWQVHLTPQGFGAISFIDTLRGWGIARVASGAEIFHTTDGGVTWISQFCICTSQDELSPAALSFVDSLNGWAFGLIFFEGDLSAAIYRTTNGGWSWYREFVTHQSRRLGDGLMLDNYHGWAVGGANVYAYKLITNIVERLPDIPKTFAVRQNYPNPFNAQTNIEYELQQSSHVTLTISDVTGKQVLQPINMRQNAGVYRVMFDGAVLASGTYYYTLKTETFTQTKQMVLLK